MSCGPVPCGLSLRRSLYNDLAAIAKAGFQIWRPDLPAYLVGVKINATRSFEKMPATALDSITVKGFKSIAAIELLPLRSVNILIGANGSGKSNFIGVFSFLHAIRDGRLRDYVTAAGGAERLLHFGSKNTKEMSFHLSFKDGINQYALTLSP